MSKFKLQDFIERSVNNINEDRAVTKTLLTTLMKYMVVSDDRHKEVGMIAAKYVETLQRSNEQMVKLTALLHKQEATNEEISDDEKNGLFDLIQEQEDSSSNGR
jgi:uncharacterized UBP type Zn finger protein